jgi:hypothetical protein
MYDVTQTHFRDLYGRLLWTEPLQEEYRLYELEEVILNRSSEGPKEFLVKRVALAENIQHVNLEPVLEQIIVTEPHL